MANNSQKITLDQLQILLVEPSSTQQRIIVNHLNGFGVMTIDRVTTGVAALDTLNSDVLVVDDSFTARNHIKRVLSNMGIERITEAKNGKEAVAILADQFFDLIVTDFNMPEMDGRQLVEHIRSHSNQSSIPVLMVSSESDDNRLAAVQQAGVSAICDKPFEPETVRELLLKMLV